LGNSYGSISPSDVKRSASASRIDDIIKFTDRILGQNVPVERIINLGCAFGGVAKVISEHFGAKEVHGVDNNSDPSIKRAAEDKGLVFHDVNLESDRVPCADGYFDMAISFGLLEHCLFFDNVLQETNRLLRAGGLCLFSLPNLGSWLSRLLLLFGYQPRDVEISQKRAFGCHPGYTDAQGFVSAVCHPHTATARGFQEMMGYYGFKQLGLGGFSPEIRGISGAIVGIRMLDGIFAKKPSLARRFIYVGTKVRDINNETH